MKNMKKNKKGFTLVELLAVIVILGVLLVIAVPGIQTVISNSRKKTFKDNVALVANTVNSLKSIDDAKSCLYYFNGDAASSDVGYVSVERGSLAGISGLIEVDSNGTVKLVYAVDKTNKFSIGTAPTINISEASGVWSYSGTGTGIVTTKIVNASVGSDSSQYSAPTNYDKVKCNF